MALQATLISPGTGSLIMEENTRVTFLSGKQAYTDTTWGIPGGLKDHEENLNIDTMIFVTLWGEKHASVYCKRRKCCECPSTRAVNKNGGVGTCEVMWVSGLEKKYDISDMAHCLHQGFTYTSVSLSCKEKTITSYKFHCFCYWWGRKILITSLSHGPTYYENVRYFQASKYIMYAKIRSGKENAKIRSGKENGVVSVKQIRVRYRIHNGSSPSLVPSPLPYPLPLIHPPISAYTLVSCLWHYYIP